MKRTICCLVAIFALNLQAADGDASHQHVAEKLYGLLSQRDMFLQSFSQIFDAQLTDLTKLGVKAEKIEQLKEAGVAFATRIADDPKLNEQMIAAYMETFTEDELIELLAFYDTPIGQKALERLPLLSERASKIGQELSIKHQKEFQARIAEILADEEKPAASPATKSDNPPDK